VLVFTEQDERFDVIVRATRSGAYILLETENRDTTETLVIPATDPGAAPAVLRERQPGVEYRADHADGPAGASSTWSPTTRRPSSGWCGARCLGRAARRGRTAGTR
jgi:protease II